MVGKDQDRGDPMTVQNYMLFIDSCSSLRSCHDPDDPHVHVCIGNHGWEDIEEIVYDVPLYKDSPISLQTKIMEMTALKLLELHTKDLEPSECGKIDDKDQNDLHPRRR